MLLTYKTGKFVRAQSFSQWNVCHETIIIPARVNSFVLKLIPVNIFRKKNNLLIIIRGAPSTGKTTIAYLLSKKIPHAYKISVDSLTGMFTLPGSKSKEWKQVRPLGQELARILTDYLLNQGKTVIAEEVFPEVRYISDLEGVAKKNKVKSYVFELITPMEILSQREGVRPDAKADKPVEKLAGYIQQNPYPGAIKINTAPLSATHCAESILGTIPANHVNR